MIDTELPVSIIRTGDDEMEGVRRLAGAVVRSAVYDVRKPSPCVKCKDKGCQALPVCQRAKRWYAHHNDALKFFKGYGFVIWLNFFNYRKSFVDKMRNKIIKEAKQIFQIGKGV